MKLVFYHISNAHIAGASIPFNKIPFYLCL